MKTWKLFSGLIAAVMVMTVCVTGVQAQTVTFDATLAAAYVPSATDGGNTALTNVAAEADIIVAVFLDGVTDLTGYSIAVQYDPTYVMRTDLAAVQAAGVENFAEIPGATVVYNILQNEAPVVFGAVSKFGDSPLATALADDDTPGSWNVTSGYYAFSAGNTYVPAQTSTENMTDSKGFVILVAFKTTAAFVANSTTAISVSKLEVSSNNVQSTVDVTGFTPLSLTAPEGPAVPVLESIADTTIEEGIALEIQAAATDANADVLTYSLDTGAPATMTIDSASGLIAWTSAVADTGANAISVIATDPGGLADTASFTINVFQVPPAAPVLAAIADVSVLAGVAVSVQATATDVNKADTVLTYTLDTGAPATATITDGLVAWTPAEADTGANSISVIVSDAGGLTDTATFVVTVSVPYVPIITAPAVVEDTAAVIAITEVNPDADADTLVAVTVDAGGATVSLAVSQIDEGDDLTTAQVSVTNEGTALSTVVTADPVLGAAIGTGGTDEITATNLLGYFNIGLSGITQGAQLRVKLTLTYDPSSFAGNEMELMVGRYNPTTTNWERHETVDQDTVNNTITVWTKNFSIWAVADTNDANFAADPAITPVEMIALDARVDVDNNVTLLWSTASETNNFGFYIERSTDTHIWEEIGFVEGHGTTENQQNYTFVDNNTEAGMHYVYRMRQVDYNGDTEISNNVAVVVAVPSEYALRQNYPNPFNPTTNISFDLKESGRVKLVLYNVLGQKVMTMIDSETMPAGMHVHQFNMGSLATGVYFYKLEVNEFSQVKKMMLLK